MSGRELSGLRILAQEAQRVLTTQTKAIRSFEQKAATLLRFDVLLLGVLATGISVAAEWTTILASTWIALGLVAGSLTLLGSAATTVIAYRSLRWKVGVRANTLRTALRYEIEEEAMLRAIVVAHSKAIAANATNVNEATRWLDWALVALLAGLSSLSATSIAFWLVSSP